MVSFEMVGYFVFIRYSLHINQPFVANVVRLGIEQDLSYNDRLTDLLALNSMLTMVSM